MVNLVVIMGDMEKSAMEKARLLVEELGKVEIYGEFRVRCGLVIDWEKYYRGSVYQLESKPVLGVYWRAGYMRLCEVREKLRSGEIKSNASH